MKEVDSGINEINPWPLGPRLWWGAVRDRRAEDPEDDCGREDNGYRAERGEIAMPRYTKTCKGCGSPFSEAGICCDSGADGDGGHINGRCPKCCHGDPVVAPHATTGFCAGDAVRVRVHWRYAGRRGRIVDAHKGHNGQMVYMVDLATTGSAAQSGESANFMLSSELEHIPCQG